MSCLWTWSCLGIPTHLHMALSLWGWPKAQLQSCRRQTSQWRLYVYSPGAQAPCSSVCRHLSPQMIALYGCSCETLPLWVCSMSGRWPGQGLQSRNYGTKNTWTTMIVHACCQNYKCVIVCNKPWCENPCPLKCFLAWCPCVWRVSLWGTPSLPKSPRWFCPWWILAQGPGNRENLESQSFN